MSGCVARPLAAPVVTQQVASGPLGTRRFEQHDTVALAGSTRLARDGSPSRWLKSVSGDEGSGIDISFNWASTTANLGPDLEDRGRWRAARVSRLASG